MGKIKKILENELVGGTQTTDVYPVTSTKAVYDENNERLDHILDTKEDVANKTQVINEASTEVEFPSAKGVWNLAETKENLANKVTSINADADDMHYPSAKAVKDSLAKVKNIEVTPDMLSESTKQFINASGGGTITNFADDEDLTTVDNALKLADKTYAPITYSGMGRKYLRKNLVDGKNILTQEMLPSANTIYIIQYDYDLNGATITIPENCTLDFQGGSLANGTLSGNMTDIRASKKRLFDNLKFIGCYVCVFYVEYWGAIPNDANVDNGVAFNNMLNSFETNNDKYENKISITKAFFKPTFIAEDTNGYYFSTTIYNSGLYFNLKASKLLYQGVEEAVLFEEIWHSNIEIDMLIHIGNTHWVNDRLRGIVFNGCQRCNININLVSNFKEAVCFIAPDGRSVYSNVIRINASFYNLKTIYIETSGRGCANHNTVYGGTADYLTGELQDQNELHRSLIHFNVNGKNPNAWVFCNNGIEGGTGRGQLESFYLEVSGSGSIENCTFDGYRIESVNNEAQALLTDGCYNLYFKNSLYEGIAIRTSSGLPIFFDGELYRGKENYTHKYVFCSNFDKYKYFKPCRLPAIIGGGKYVGETLGCVNIKESKGVSSADDLEIAIKLNVKKFYVRRYATKRISIRFFDGAGEPIQDIDKQGVVVLSTREAAQFGYYWAYNNSSAYTTSLVSSGESNYNEFYIDATASNAEYITISGIGYYEILSEEINGLSYIDCVRDGIRIDNRELWNVGIIGAVGEVYYNDLKTYVINKNGIISDIASYILDADFTSTSGSNVLTVSNYINFLWVGFEAVLNNKRFVVQSIDTNNNQITTSTIFEEDYTGKITLDEGDISIIGYSADTESINSIELKKYYIGSILYDNNKDIFNYVKQKSKVSSALAKLDPIKSGLSSTRPVYDADYVGARFFDTTLNKPIWWTGTAWVDATGAEV